MAAQSPVVLQALATLDTTFMVQDVDEFLQDFSLVQFENPDVISIFDILIAPRYPPLAEVIGEASGVGTVYRLGNGAGVPAPLQGKILKKSSMCPGGNVPAHPLLAQLCNMARTGDLIFRIPNTETGKMIVLAPNYILEGICGVLLSRQDPYTPAFMQVTSFQYDNGPSKSVYMVQEPLISLNDIIGAVRGGAAVRYPERDFAFVAFQIAQGLATAQLASRFTHYDLHQGNIMARRSRGTSIYEIGNGQYLYTRRPADAVIIDYGHVRMETQDSVLQPNMWFRLGGVYNREIMDWYEFNPYYDLFSFIFTQEKKSRLRNAHGFPQWKPVAGTRGDRHQKSLFQMLWRAFLNTQSGANESTFITNLLDHIRGGRGNHWRPIPERLAMKWTDPVTNLTFSRASTPEEFMVKMVGTIKSFLPPFAGSPSDLAYLNQYLDDNDYHVSTQITKLDTVGSPTRVYKLPRSVMLQEFYNYKIDNDLVEVLPGIGGNIATIAHERWTSTDPAPEGSVRALVTRCAPGVGWAPWNLTGRINDPANQVITVATIDVARGLREGYEFRLDCCRLDLRAYFQDVDVISSGIGINAAFFKIKRPGASYLPIGDFRTAGFSSDLPIPQEYLEWYGVVAIQDNGKLAIVQPATAGAYRQILTSGPVLVGFDHASGTVRNMVGQGLPYGGAGTWPRRIDLGNRRFQCNIPPHVVGMNNCNTISPGEFSHASNPNPRSALGLKADGTTLLVTVQGRGANAAGMDLEQLAQLMVSLGCHWAINLDGGRGSRMVWRNPGETLVRLASGAQDGMGAAEAYPVGSVLAFVKK